MVRSVVVCMYVFFCERFNSFVLRLCMDVGVCLRNFKMFKVTWRSEKFAARNINTRWFVCRLLSLDSNEFVLVVNFCVFFIMMMDFYWICCKSMMFSIIVECVVMRILKRGVDTLLVVWGKVLMKDYLCCCMVVWYVVELLYLMMFMFGVIWLNLWD